MKKTAGYALLEIVVCVAISAIIIAGSAAAFGSASRMNAMAREKLHDEIIVQNKAEELLATGLDSTFFSEGDIQSGSGVTIKQQQDNTNYFEIKISSTDNEDVFLTLNVKKNVADGGTP